MKRGAPQLEKSKGEAITAASYAIIFNIVGLLISVHLAASYIFDAAPFACDVSELVSCNKLLESEHAFVFKVPLSVYGVCYFFLAFWFCVFLAAPRTDDREVAAGFLVLNVIGVLSCVYFVYLEIKLGAICLMCTGVHAVVLVSVAFAWKVYKLRAPGWRWSPRSTLQLGWELNLWVLFAILIVGTPIVASRNPFVAVLRGVVTNVAVNAVTSPTYAEEDLEKFGQCLADNHAILYGMAGCPHCKSQYRVLGAGLRFVKQEDCLADRKRCEAEGVTRMPSWKVTWGRNRRTLEGVQSLEDLAAATGCPAPKEI